MGLEMRHVTGARLQTAKKTAPFEEGSASLARKSSAAAEKAALSCGSTTACLCRTTRSQMLSPARTMHATTLARMTQSLHPESEETFNTARMCCTSRSQMPDRKPSLRLAGSWVLQAKPDLYLEALTFSRLKTLKGCHEPGFETCQDCSPVAQIECFFCCDQISVRLQCHSSSI